MTADRRVGYGARPLHPDRCRGGPRRRMPCGHQDPQVQGVREVPYRDPGEMRDRGRFQPYAGRHTRNPAADHQDGTGARHDAGQGEEGRGASLQRAGRVHGRRREHPSAKRRDETAFRRIRMQERIRRQDGTGDGRGPEEGPRLRGPFHRFSGPRFPTSSPFGFPMYPAKRSMPLRSSRTKNTNGISTTKRTGS